MSIEQRSVFAELLELSHRLLAQEKRSKDKVYSLHEPHVYCVSKGEARCPYEFGFKVSLVVTHKQGFALSSRALEKPSYDGHTLASALDHGREISGIDIKRAFVDRGYKGVVCGKVQELGFCNFLTNI